MAEDYTQMNANITVTDAKQLDRMMVEDGFDNRSAFIRCLIRREWGRRYGQPNPAISLQNAVEAGKAIE
jgi:metal-responsive CopG/Arc/MetJ family transcriptional regulator